MKKSYISIALTVLLLTACGKSSDVIVETTTVKEVVSSEPVTENVLSEVNTETNTEEIVYSEDDMLSCIENNIAGSINTTEYKDFDLDGKYEMFAVVTEDDFADATLWFSNGVEASRVTETGDMSGYIFETMQDGRSFIYTSGISMGYVLPVYQFITVYDNSFIACDLQEEFEKRGGLLRYNAGNFYFLDTESSKPVSSSPIYPIYWGTTSFCDYPIKDIAKTDIPDMDTNNLVVLPDNITDLFMRGDNWLHINYVSPDGVNRSKTYYVENDVVVSDITDDTNVEHGYFGVDILKRNLF